MFQLAFASALRFHALSRKFPKEERYALTDQGRRSSRSVSANIAEAWRKRCYPAAFANKLSDADAEAAETLVWLAFALEFGYIDQAEHDELEDAYDRICGQLTKMIDHPEQWSRRT